MAEFQVGERVRVVQHRNGVIKRVPVGEEAEVRKVERYALRAFYLLVGDDLWVYSEEELVAAVPKVEHMTYLVTCVAKHHLLEPDWETKVYTQSNATLEDAESEIRWLEANEYLVLGKKLVKIRFSKPEAFEDVPVDEDDNLIEDVEEEDDDGEL